MTIREAGISDLESLRELSVQLGYACDKGDLLLRFQDIIQSPEHFIFVVEDGTIICGYIHLNIYRSLYFDKTMNVMGIVIDSGYRSRGIGSLLMKKAESTALKAGCSGIRALSGSYRERAHSFYIQNSFEYGNEKKLFIKNLDHHQ